MEIEFLVQMRQPDKCESVRNDDIFNIQLSLPMHGENAPHEEEMTEENFCM